LYLAANNNRQRSPIHRARISNYRFRKRLDQSGNIK